MAKGKAKMLAHENQAKAEGFDLIIGIDEAGAQFVAETVAAGVGIGVTLAIIRKGRILFWTAIGLMLIIKRGISLRKISNAAAESTV